MNRQQLLVKMLVHLQEELNLNLDSKLGIKIKEKLGMVLMVWLLPQISISHVLQLLQLYKVLEQHGILNLLPCQLIDLTRKKFINTKLSSMKTVQIMYGQQLQGQLMQENHLHQVIYQLIGVNHFSIGFHQDFLGLLMLLNNYIRQELLKKFPLLY